MNYAYLPALLLSLPWLNTAQAQQQEEYALETLHLMSLNELLNLEVVSASRTKQRAIDAPANVTVINAKTIFERGYQNLIDVLRDVPGFDFATVEDSAGEYTTHSINRAIGGSPGNVQLLILIDGVVQNHIAFNWSQPFGNQQIFSDLKRIEIIQGPGSASYGANAYSGVIHFITAAQDDELTNQVTTLIGQNNRHSTSFAVDKQLSELYLQLSGRLAETDGDSGLDRFDPAGYFSAHAWPVKLTQQYIEGNYIENSANPFANTQQAAGFNNQSRDWALRGKAIWQPSNFDNGIRKIALSFNKWVQRQGLGSYVTGFEYQTRADSFQKHHQSGHVALDIDYQWDENHLITSKLWYRENIQKPDTGFQYSYRFIDLVKSYHSVNSQVGFEQQLEVSQNNANWLLGYRIQHSKKMDQVVSLGQYQSGQNSVSTSLWADAVAGLGLFQTGNAGTRKVEEHALYGQYQQQLTEKINYTLGFRFDHSDEYGSTTNPRFGLIYNADKWSEQLDWRIKLLYGRAFREPSIFELSDEFRGNNNLKPESISTYELVSHWLSSNPNIKANLKAAIFFSQQDDTIALEAQNSDGGSRYINANSGDVYGFSLDGNWQLSKGLTSYFNYQFTDGKQDTANLAIAHTAKHKINWGLSYNALNEQLNINFRMNHLLSRSVPLSNSYFEHKAPNASIANLVMSWQGWQLNNVNITPQLIINNVFDHQYLGVGRQDGSSDVTQYNAATNVNPIGFAPPYHPEPGRTIAAQLTATF
ncbi:TonB-dependent receptor plug domain-containing protein [Pseudoalteromonas tunicata]|uniref:TonB-dependent receptor plug domain-containing protein n=1 Tax=Pseudoalteromonas tunicata TaxID=314281 RepID=UPI002740285E|nr:TonB-dependent receptor [Pseudoalteromonas tunicata]MDP4985060.1 TonB-dependent receptor [Pseudoalteromonas tunicata]